MEWSGRERGSDVVYAMLRCYGVSVRVCMRVAGTRAISSQIRTPFLQRGKVCLEVAYWSSVLCFVFFSSKDLFGF